VSVLSLLQDPVNAGGIGTVDRWYGTWMDRHRPAERREYYFDDHSGGTDVLRAWRHWNGSEPGIPRLLPALHVPQYMAGRALLRRVDADETHVVGAVAVHGSAAPLDVPTLVWCATTIADERTAVLPHHTASRRAFHRLTLPALASLERRVLRAATRVLAMSPHTARCIRALGVPASRIDVEPVPVDTDVFRPEDVERRGLLFVGRTRDRRKGFDRALDLLRSSPAAQRQGLTVVSPDEPPELEGTLTGAVHWLGAVDDIAQCHRSAEVLVLTSHQEGLGIVAFEALASGTPVVALECGGPDDFLRESGGAVVAAGMAELTSAVELLLAEPGLRAERGAKGRDWVESNMSSARFLASTDLFRAGS